MAFLTHRSFLRFTLEDQMSWQSGAGSMSLATLFILPKSRLGLELPCAIMYGDERESINHKIETGISKDNRGGAGQSWAICSLGAEKLITAQPSTCAAAWAWDAWGKY
ncbi:hypothetical protein AC579_7151 [Pseudocercospora musae]|uniref:Uncharacterized protein n=1 Tax=Pseudocercospora musae TaxID=113226 RepID=A0A139GTM5_9PEZI|nr:hypothetical protein AC579_7151 [Pseudocercospora musae]